MFKAYKNIKKVKSFLYYPIYQSNMYLYITYEFNVGISCIAQWKTRVSWLKNDHWWSLFMKYFFWNCFDAETVKVSFQIWKPLKKANILRQWHKTLMQEFYICVMLCLVKLTGIYYNILLAQSYLLMART